MAHPGGIITVSFGKFASYVGAHYWNFQVRNRCLQKVRRPARLLGLCSMPQPNRQRGRRPTPLLASLMTAQQQDTDRLQDETLGYLVGHDLSPAAEEVLAGKLFTHGKQPHPRLIVVDQTGCCGGAHFHTGKKAAGGCRGPHVCESAAPHHCLVHSVDTPDIQYRHVQGQLS
jgi:Misato Segment II tubulin-like domain